MQSRYKKIRKKIPLHLCPTTISKGHIYNKKAGLQSCCSAFWGSGIAFVTNSNTVAHAVRIYYLGTRFRAYTYTHTIGILVSQCFVTFNEIYQISECQNKARKTLFYHVLYPSALIGHFPDVDYTKNFIPRSAITEYGAKVHKKNDIRK